MFQDKGQRLQNTTRDKYISDTTRDKYISDTTRDKYISDTTRDKYINALISILNKAGFTWNCFVSLLIFLIKIVLNCFK